MNRPTFTKAVVDEIRSQAKIPADCADWSADEIDSIILEPIADALIAECDPSLCPEGSAHFELGSTYTESGNPWTFTIDADEVSDWPFEGCGQ